MLVFLNIVQMFARSRPLTNAEPINLNEATAMALEMISSVDTDETCQPCSDILMRFRVLQ